MNISFYTAAVGAGQQQERLNVHANNIANVNTFGFRAKKPAFQPLKTGPVRGIEEDVTRGVGARMEAADTDFGSSGFTGTGLYTDYAIDGHGFFALLDPTSGEYSYTRDGSFIKSEYYVRQEDDEMPEVAPGNVRYPGYERRWYLSDGNGRFVLGTNGRPIEMDDSKNALDVGIFDFINYNGMQSLSENRVIPVEKNGQVGLGSGTLVQGYLELSNTDLANEFAKVIESQRSFQYMLRMVTTSDEIETTVNNLR